MLFRWRCVIQVRGPALSLAPPVPIISKWLVRSAPRSWGQCMVLDTPSPLGGASEWAREFFEEVESCGLVGSELKAHSVLRRMEQSLFELGFFKRASNPYRDDNL